MRGRSQAPTQRRHAGARRWKRACSENTAHTEIFYCGSVACLVSQSERSQPSQMLTAALSHRAVAYVGPTRRPPPRSLRRRDLAHTAVDLHTTYMPLLWVGGESRGVPGVAWSVAWLTMSSQESETSKSELEMALEYTRSTWPSRTMRMTERSRRCGRAWRRLGHGVRLRTFRFVR